MGKYKELKKENDIINAIETLAEISELNIDDTLGISLAEDLLFNNKIIANKTIKWLGDSGASGSASIIQSAFSKVLSYLKLNLKNIDSHGRKRLDQIENIILIAGEAARKLDSYTNIFQETNTSNIVKWKEYLNLKAFYDKKIANFLKGDSALENKGQAEEKNRGISLEDIRQDRRHELFFLKKEDGTPFFTNKLLNNMKLICDFDIHLKSEHLNDPITKVKLWEDKILHEKAKYILGHMQTMVADFYKEFPKYKHLPLLQTLQNAITALMFAANPHNLLTNEPRKSCFHYFYDFQVFLRKALCSDGYNKLIVYPPKSQPFLKNVPIIIHNLCYYLYVHPEKHDETVATIQNISNSYNNNNNDSPWEEISNDYAAMKWVMEQHPNGPIFKTIDILTQNLYNQAFDPFMQGSLPYLSYKIYSAKQKVSLIHMPTPIKQKEINRATISHEFKAIIRHQEENKQKILLINLQNRNSEEEKARCKVLEGLNSNSEFNNTISTITIDRSSSFYFQEAPYNHISHTTDFMQLLCDHINNSLYIHLSPLIKANLTSSDFINKIIHKVGENFFQNKQTISKIERRLFIEITYYFIILKALEISNGNFASFICREGTDRANSSEALFYIISKFFLENNSDLKMNLLKDMLIARPLLIRERYMHNEYFELIPAIMKKMSSIYKNKKSSAKIKTALRGLFKQSLDAYKIIEP